MTDKEIVERAKKAEKGTCFGELVHSPISKGVNSAFGIGFIEGMVEYRNSLQEEPVSEELDDAAIQICQKVLKGETIVIDGYEYVVLSDAEECFKAGAKWQLNRLQKQKDGK